MPRARFLKNETFQNISFYLWQSLLFIFFVTNLSKSLRSLRAPEIQPIEMKNTPAEIFSEMTTGS